MEKKSLAIVIPAYKDMYLGRTLSSLVSQTCKDFKVYIGDDASPYGVKEVVESFSDELDVVYHRFDTNLGSVDLVGQWQRCLDLVGDEEWVCLFSDDDMMEPRCVESFMDVHVNSSLDVVHFNLSFIDENDLLIKQCTEYPLLLSSADFYSRLFHREIDARMPEFVFRKDSLKLISFDLAWRSDTATVMSAAYPNGILTIEDSENARVLWRCSADNVSGRKDLIERKNNVNLLFHKWVEAFFEKRNIEHPYSRFYRLKTLVFSLEFTDMHSFFSYGWSKVKEFPLVYMLLLCYRVLYWYVKER